MLTPALDTTYFDFFQTKVLLNLPENQIRKFPKHSLSLFSLIANLSHGKIFLISHRFLFLFIFFLCIFSVCPALQREVVWAGMMGLQESDVGFVLKCSGFQYLSLSPSQSLSLCVFH